MQFFFKFAEGAAFSQPIFNFAEWAAFSQPIFKFAECVATSSTARSLEWRAVHRFLAAEEGVHILQVPEGCVA